jgi:dihydropyrimidinase
MGLVVRHGTVITAEERWVGDIRCEDGLIAALGAQLEPEPGDEVIDAGDRLVLPGGVDPHVHLSLPVAGTVSTDDFLSGSSAALAGGTTTFIDFVHPERGQDPLEALALRKEEALASLADYGFHMAITWWGDETGEAMRRCVEQEGIPSFKVYLAYLDTVGLGDRDLVRVMARAEELDATVVTHAEHGEIVEFLRSKFAAQGDLEPRFHALSRPPEAEGEATHRAAVLAGLTGARLYVVHVTCRQAVEAIEAARARGWRVSGETCPQYLLLDVREYERPDFEGAAFVIAPPLRPAEHQEALWSALERGVLDVVATDHCPFDLKGQKELGRHDFRLIPGGAAGIEHRLQLLYTHGVRAGRFGLRRFVELVSTGPARRFGLYPRKGAIRVGSDADLVVWDPAATATLSAASHLHRCDRSIYEGMPVLGGPSAVVLRGRVAFREGRFEVEEGYGRFLRRSLDGPERRSEAAG